MRPGRPQPGRRSPVGVWCDEEGKLKDYPPNCKATALWWAREALSWRDEMSYAARCSSPAGWTKMATVDQCHKRSSICGKRSASSKTGGYL